jgi:hypothetical protein
MRIDRQAPRTHAAVDVIVAWNDERAIAADADLVAQRAQEIGGFGPFVRFAGLRHIAGEEDE